MTQIKSPALRYHGGKFRLAPWIIAHFPAHRCYVEPFGGAMSVLLRKQPSFAEVYNDRDGDVVNFFRVLRDPDQREQLIERLSLTPYSRDEFKAAYAPTDCPIESARRIAIRSQMGFGSAGATKNTTGFRLDTKRSSSTALHVWKRYPQTLIDIAERLKNVVIENKCGMSVMRDHDAPDTLHFVDPPYPQQTRVIKSSSDCYRFELTEEQHNTLLITCNQQAGFVLLSTYKNELYSNFLLSAGWFCVEKTVLASANRGAKKAVEQLWLNPACQSALNQHRGAA